jgi:hypothetical protein
MDRVILHDQQAWARENSAVALADAIENFEHHFPSIPRQELFDTTAAVYSWSRVFEQLLCIYREVCANYQPAS